MQENEYESVVTMYKDRVHSYAMTILRNPTEAQDAAQEALIRLWEHRTSVPADGARPWLLRTTHNLCVDHIRRRKVRSEVGDGDDWVETRPDEGPGPQKLAESSDLRHSIDRALATLSPEDRAVIVMREVQNLPYDEIAAALDVPLGTLKARLHRARERLRTKLFRTGVTPWARQQTG
jgi:RNA polymerase sigma-70 factor (ECF subfamily)